MHDRDPKVVVVGAAGFVGREVLAALERAGISAVAIARGNPEIVGADGFHRVLPDLGEVEPGSVQALINLAYPTSGTVDTYRAQTDALFHQIDRVLGDRGHLVHVSTLAVFGMAVDHPITVGPVSARRDVPYVEAKLAAEHLAARLQRSRGRAVEIVRLGNVVGYASPGWVRGLVHRLVTGRPVGVRDVDGLSNSTDVANVGAYLAHLVDAEAAPGVRYHHVAEFSSVAWRDWIDPLAVSLGVEPVYADQRVGRAPTIREELGVAFAGFSPRRIYRMLREERVMGSWMRAMRRWVPDRAIPRLENEEAVFAADPVLDREEETFLAIMSVRQEFVSATSPGWTPPVGKQEAIERMLAWLERDWRLD